MKILFIGSTKYDYLQDILFSGLYKILGSSKLTTINFHKNYFLPIKSYPKNLGQASKSVGTFSPIFALNFKKYDAVIIGSAKPDAFQSYHQIKEKIPSNCPIIFIDGGDMPGIAEDLIRLKREELLPQKNDRPFDLIFKREYLIGTEYPENILPLPFGINFDIIDRIKRLPAKYNLAFWAVESHPIRTEALQIIENKFDCKSNGTTTNQTFKDYKRKGKFYLEEIKRSKITLNFRGGGWDTLRYWEVPALGSFMISQKPGIVIPNNFKDDEHLKFVENDLSNLIDLVDYYLENEIERERLAKNAELHARVYHSDISRANTVIDEIKKLVKSS